MAKKTKKPKKSVKPHTLYEKTGEGLKRKNKNCPKCGKGIFLAAHKGRLTCGKCGYTEFLGKAKKEEPKEEKKPEKKEEKK